MKKYEFSNLKAKDKVIDFLNSYFDEIKCESKDNEGIKTAGSTTGCVITTINLSIDHCTKVLSKVTCAGNPPKLTKVSKCKLKK